MVARYFACVLTFFYLQRSSLSTPFIRRSLTPVGNGVDGLSNDAGPIDSCMRPEESPVCGVDYSVPTSLAAIAPAIELNIAGISNSISLYRTETCMAAAREVACAQRFPRCDIQEDGEVLVRLSSDGCEDKLRASCHEATVKVLLEDGYCSLRNATRETAECKSTAEFAAESPQLQYCTQELQVTPWMYELLLYYDTLFGGIAEELERQFTQTCFQRQANFTCQLLGECSENGQRVVIINTRQMCETFIDCFPTSHANGLRQQYNCDHWPEEVVTAPPSSPPSPSSRGPHDSTTGKSTTTISTVGNGGTTSSARLSLAILFASAFLTTL